MPSCFAVIPLMPVIRPRIFRRSRVNIRRVSEITTDRRARDRAYDCERCQRPTPI